MIRHFKKGDLENFKFQDKQLLEGSPEEFDNQDTVVFEEDGKVMAMIRPLFYDEGCILAALISKDCGYKAVKLVKQASKIISGLKQDNGFVEITTQVGWEQAERLARVLGFEPDRLLKNFYNGMDFNAWRLE